MNKDIWEKIGRIKTFDSQKRGFIGYCYACEDNVDKGKEIIIERAGLRKWIRVHAGACMNKLMKQLKKQ